MAQTILLVVHVLTAVLGIGQIAALAALVAKPQTKESLLGLGAIMRTMTWSLLIMILTGGALDGVSHGAFHAQWWFRISFLTMFLLGFLMARMRRPLRMLEAGKIELESARSSVAMLSRIVAFIVAVLTVLMATKPF